MTLLAIALPVADEIDGEMRYDFALSADGSTLTRQGQALASELPVTRSTEVILVLAGEGVSWHRLELPSGVLGRRLGMRSAERLRAVLSGMLEEMLLDDPADLHFSLPSNAAHQRPIWVAVCQRAWLMRAISDLQRAGIAVNRIVPEWFPQEGAQDKLLCVPRRQGPQLVIVQSTGVRVLPMNTGSLVLLPQSVIQGTCGLFAEPGLAERAQELLQHGMSIQVYAQRLVGACTTDWNLAQFEFARSAHSNWWHTLRGIIWEVPQWRPVRLALTALVLVNVVGLNLWAWKERSHWASLREAQRHTLLEAFPDTPVIVDAPRQMARRLELLRQSTGQAGGAEFETMLSALGQALPTSGSQDSMPDSIDFQTGKLRLQGIVLEPTAFDAVANTLRRNHYILKQDGNVLSMGELVP